MVITKPVDYAIRKKQFNSDMFDTHSTPAFFFAGSKWNAIHHQL